MYSNSDILDKVGVRLRAWSVVLAVATAATTAVLGTLCVDTSTQHH